MAAVYANKGHRVIGVDLNEKFVESINQKQAPVQEKDLQEFLVKSENLEATTNYEHAINNSDITFIIVPSPTDPSGGFSTKYIEEACKQIGECLKTKNSFHLVVVTSTVLPGDSREKLIPVLEEFSTKQCGSDFGFCYSPEFIAIGSVIRDLLNPDFFLIGEYDKKSGDVLEKFYQTISDNNAPMRRMSISSAELTKISVNSFLTMKITYGNMLAEIAENIPGVNVNDVAEALGSDKRIGKQYLKGGLGYGGPCFPRDNRAFNYVAQKYGTDAPYALATDQYNSSIVEKTVKKIKHLAPLGSTIGVVGLSYKPGTHFAEESQAIMIAQTLADIGYHVHVFNPAGNEHCRTLLGDRVVYHSDLLSCLKASQVLFLSNADPAISSLPSLLNENISKIVIDPWRQFKPEIFSSNVKYIPFGIGL
jgi:UDPglucose 6-dehydrogenase